MRLFSLDFSYTYIFIATFDVFIYLKKKMKQKVFLIHVIVFGNIPTAVHYFGFG